MERAAARLGVANWQAPRASQQTDPVPTPHADLQPIHTRAYDVRAFRKSSDEILLRGRVQDTKPAGLYIQDDPEPLVIHHMTVELVITLPSMEITGAEVEFHVNPHEQCPTIIEHYSKLVGLSIARGFTHKVRELFGGPRGCTHTTALLQAMAPVAIQCVWSMRAAAAKDQPVQIARRKPSQAEREAMWAFNLNTCHVWDEQGENVARMRAGALPEPPVWAVKRFAELGIDPQEWASRMGG